MNAIWAMMDRWPSSALAEGRSAAERCQWVSYTEEKSHPSVEVGSDEQDGETVP